MPKMVRIICVTEDMVKVSYGLQVFCVRDFFDRNNKLLIKRVVNDIGGRKNMKLGTFLTIVHQNKAPFHASRNYNND